MDKHLHIITLDVPFPVAHGGLTDLFYKLKALYEQGVNIHLHCFKRKGRKEEPELQKYCVSVKYYDRETGIGGVSLTIPYIVRSRSSDALVDELKKDDHPILMEGIHCTSILLTDEFINRKLFVRLHNIEHIYYKKLSLYEKNILKRTYFKTESRLLKKYEKAISPKAIFLAVNEQDAALYKKQFQSEIYYLPVFIPYTDIHSLTGKGSYCLYHGNLSVNENEEAAIWLLEIFKRSGIPLIIAGKEPSPRLCAAISKDITLVADPTEEKMQDLIANTQLHILPSLNSTGIKLKLLNALFNGRHCLVNEKGVSGTGLNNLCSVAESAEEFRSAVKKLYEVPFANDQIDLRRKILLTIFNNKKNAEELMTLIW